MSKSLEERASGLVREASFKPLEYDTTGLINPCLQLIVDQAQALTKAQEKLNAEAHVPSKRREEEPPANYTEWDWGKKATLEGYRTAVEDILKAEDSTQQNG